MDTADFIGWGSAAAAVCGAFFFLGVRVGSRGAANFFLGSLIRAVKKPHELHTLRELTARARVQNFLRRVK